MPSSSTATDTMDSGSDKSYHLVSVEETNGAVEGDSATWYRYTIKGGTACISGLHRGTLAEVTEYAQACAESFNERSVSKNASALTWSSRSKKPKAGS